MNDPIFEQTLLNQIEIASKRGAQYNIEIMNEELIPTLIFVTASNDIKVAPIEVDKKDIPLLLSHILYEQQAKAYSLILEAWSTPFMEKALEYGGRVRDMPLDDRFEIVNILLVQRNIGVYKYLISRIDTNTDGSRRLKEWDEGTVKGHNICVTSW